MDSFIIIYQFNSNVVQAHLFSTPKFRFTLQDLNSAKPGTKPVVLIKKSSKRTSRLIPMSKTQRSSDAAGAAMWLCSKLPQQISAVSAAIH